MSERIFVKGGQQKSGVEERARNVGRGAEVTYKEVEGKVNSLGREGKRVGERGLKKGLNTMHRCVTDAVSEQRSELDRQTGELTTTYTTHSNCADRSSRPCLMHCHSSSSGASGPRGGFGGLQRGLDEHSERVEQGKEDHAIVGAHFRVWYRRQPCGVQNTGYDCQVACGRYERGCFYGSHAEEENVGCG